MEENNSPIVERMKALCDRFYSESGAVKYDFTPFFRYPGEAASDAAAEYDFGGFEMAFLFSSRIGKVSNILECRIGLAEGDERIDFSLYDLLYLLDENDFHCYIFPYIDTPDRLEACLGVLFEAVSRYSQRLGAVGTDPQLASHAKRRKEKEMYKFFQHNVLDAGGADDPILEWKMRTYREWYVLRFCSGWYSAYLNGDYARAAKKLAAASSHSAYEIRLLRFIKTLVAGASYTATDPYTNTHSLKGSFGVGIGSAVLRTLLYAAPCFVGYYALALLAYFCIYHGALFCTSLTSAGMPVTAALCALFTGNALREHPLPFSKKTDAATPSPLRKAKARGLHALIIFSALLLIFSAKSGVAFYERGVVDNTSLAEQRTAMYTDVTDVYKAMDTGTYYLLFKDGAYLPCTERIANEYVLSRIDLAVKPVSSFEELK